MTVPAEGHAPNAAARQAEFDQWAAVVSLIERLTHDDSATPRPVLYDRVRDGCWVLSNSAWHFVRCPRREAATDDRAVGTGPARAI